MSKAAELNQDGHESVTNGSLEKRIGDAETLDVEGDEGEESDDYEEIDDEEGGPIAGDEEDEGEEVEQGQNTLTHFLLGNTNGATAENEVEFEEDEEVDEGEDDEDDDEYVEDEDESYAPPISPTRKRSIDEVADDEASQGSKKLKA